MGALLSEVGYRKRRLPLALVLLVGLVGLVTAAVASVLWLSIASAQRSVRTLVGERTELTIENVIGHMRLHLDQPREQAEFLATLIGRDSDSAIAPRLQDLMLGSMAGVPQVEGLAFLDNGGHALWIERETAAMEVTISRRVQAPEVKAAFDDARQRTGAYWGPIIWSARLKRPLLNLRTPVRRGAATVGVLLTFVALDELSDMLTAGRYGQGENTFILLGRDAVLAHPNLTPGLPPLSSSHPVPSLDEVGDPTLAGMWTGRDSASRDNEYFGSGLGHIAKIGGEEYVFLYRELAEYGDTPWLFGRYFRLSDVDAEVRRIAATASWGLLILIVAAACALLLDWLP